MLKLLSKRSIYCFISIQALIYTIGIFSSSFFSIHIEAQKWEKSIYPNISISGFSVVGKTKEEAISFLQTQYLHQLNNYKLIVTINKNTFSLPLSKLLIDNNLEKCVNKAFIYGKSSTLLTKYQILHNKSVKNFPIVFTYDEQLLQTFLEKIASSVSIAPIEPCIFTDTTNQLQIKNGTCGKELDQAALLTAFKEALSCPIVGDIHIRASMKTIMPIHTIKELKKVDSEIASFSTTFSNHCSGQATNIRLATNAINHTIVFPNETFSFNKKIGETTLEKGYQLAPVIANNQIVQGLGGGICQVSSTLYNAILLTGLHSIERTSHSKPSSYVPLGLDATVSINTLDYKFKNTFSYPLLIEAYIQNNQVMIRIYSHHSLLDATYKLESIVYQTLPPPTYYQPNSHIYSNVPKLITQGTNGYKVKTVRHKYQKDKLISSEIISYDLYKPSPTIYYVQSN